MLRRLGAGERIAAIMADRQGLPPNMDLYAGPPIQHYVSIEERQ